MGNEPERSIFQKDEREYLLSNQADRVELLSRRLPEHLGFAAENLDKIIMPGVERCQAMKQAGKWQPLSDVKSSLHSAYQEPLAPWMRRTKCWISIWRLCIEHGDLSELQPRPQGVLFLWMGFISARDRKRNVGIASGPWDAAGVRQGV